MNPHIKQLNEQVWFQEWLKNEVLSDPVMSPVEYNPKDNNVEEWKTQCLMKQGYLRLLAKMGVKL